MKFLPGSKSPQIVELYNSGLHPADIARVVECSRSNVHKSLRRHLDRKDEIRNAHTRVSPLALKDMMWLQDEARRLNISSADLARAMLVDAINEARAALGEDAR